MPRFASVAFTKEVKALQERYGSRASYARRENPDADPSLTPEEIEFVEARDSFFLATVTSDGWPYVQHRGGPRGFLRVLDPRRLAFADYAGNKQYVSTGNVQGDGRVALMLMDYASQNRLKILGRARIVEPEDDSALLELLRPPTTYAARIERLFVIEIAAWDWNCQQHITPRYTLEEARAFLSDA